MSVMLVTVVMVSSSTVQMTMNALIIRITAMQMRPVLTQKDHSPAPVMMVILAMAFLVMVIYFRVIPGLIGVNPN